LTFPPLEQGGETSANVAHNSKPASLISRIVQLHSDRIEAGDRVPRNTQEFLVKQDLLLIYSSTSLAAGSHLTYIQGEG
jgi:hypothetical protein